MADLTATCPVEAELLGIDIGVCGSPVTHAVTFECENGCPRPPREICEFHATLLAKEDPSATCGTCRQGRLRPLSVTLLGATDA